jgi:hypothetical protein
VVQSNAQASNFLVNITTNTALAGNPFSVEVTARDIGNNTVATYTGTVLISGSDSTGTLGATSYEFTLADGGTHTFTGFDSKLAGKQYIYIVDQDDELVTGKDSVTVIANTPTQISIDNLTSNTTIGALYNPSVSVRDQYNNISTSYVGTIQFTTPDTLLSHSYNLADNGRHTFANVNFHGPVNVSQNVIAIETTGNGFRDTLVVTPRSTGTPTDFLVTFPDTITAGSLNSMTIVAVDGFGTEVVDYAGSITLSTSADSSIFASAAPIDFSVIDGDTTLTDFFQLMSSTQQTITLTDAGNGLNKVVSVYVRHAEVDTAILTLEAASFYVNGQSYDLTIELRDEYGNRAIFADSTVNLSGVLATTPANYTFTLGNAGIHKIIDGVLFTSDGTASVTALSQDGATFSGILNNIAVTASNIVTNFLVSGYTDPILAGTTSSVTITARNANNQVVTTFADTVLLTSTDVNIQNLPDTLFFTGGDNGVITVPGVSFRTVLGNHYINAALKSNASVFGRQTGITVTPAALNSIAISLPVSRIKSGTETTLDMTLYDEFSNIKSDFVGNVTLESTEDASLPYTTYSIVQTATNQNAKVKQFLTLQDLPSDAGAFDEYADGVTAVGFKPIAGYISTFNGVEYTWQKESDADGHFQYSSGNNLFKNSVVYVYSETTREVDIAISAEDGHGLYVNGISKGFSTTQGGNQTSRGFLYDVTLNAGWNTILFAVRNSDNTTWYANLAIYENGLAGTVAFSTGTAATGLIYTNDYPTLVPSTNRTVSFTAGNLGTKSAAVSFITLGESRSLTVTSGSVTSNTVNVDVTPAFFTLTSDSSVSATTDFSATVTQQRYNRATDTNLVPSETVTLTTSDNGSVVMPAGHTFTAPDNGTHTFTGIQLATQGTQKLRVSDGFASDSVDVVVESNLDATQFEVTVSNTQPLAGNLVSVTIRAKDQGNNNVPTYTGVVSLTSTDNNATLTTPIVFDIADGGVRTISNQIFRTAGTRVVSVVDTNDLLITGADTILVRPGLATDLTIDGLTTNITIGSTYAPIVSARDQFGNIATNYAGSIRLTADSSAYSNTLAYSIGNAGQRTFNNLIFSGTVSETQNVIAYDLSNSNLRDTVVVTLQNAGTVTDFNVTLGAGVDTLTAGQAVALTLVAVDGSLNEVEDYAGTVTITTNSDSATLNPTSIDFSTIDGDTTIAAAINLMTAGNRTITFTDVANNLQRIQNVYVRPAVVDTAVLTLQASPTYIVGQTYDLTIELRDAFGNRAIFADSTVALSNSLGNIQSSYAFTLANAGIHTLQDTVRFTTDGTATIAALSQDGTSFSGAINNITVNPAATLNRFVVSGYPDPQRAGQVGTITVTAFDGQNDTLKTFTGVASLVSSDGSIQNLPSTINFTAPDSGRLAVSNISFRTVGTHYIEARLQSNALINGRQSNITITPDTVHSFVMAVSDPRIVSGQLTDLSITLKDQYNNTVNNYVGDITLSSQETTAAPLTTYTLGGTGSGKAKVKNVLTVSGLPSNGGSFDELVENITNTKYHVAENAIARFNNQNYTWVKEADADGHYTTNPSNNTFKNMVVYVHSTTSKNIDIAVSAVNDHRLYMNGSLVGQGTVTGSQTTYGAFYEDVPVVAGWNTVVFAVRKVTAAMTHSLAFYQVNTKTNSLYDDGTPANITYTNDSPYLVPSTGKTISFISTNYGAKTVPVSIAKTGNNILTASRGNRSTVSPNIEVTPAYMSLGSYPSQVAAGTFFSLQVNAFNMYNQTAKLQPSSVTVGFTSSDGSATLPTTRTLLSSDSGAVLFNNEFRLVTAGNQTITATLSNGNETVSRTTTPVDVTVSNTVNSYQLSMAPGNKTSGRKYRLQVTAVDVSSNRVVNYQGTARITSSDASMVLPSNYKFTLADSGRVYLPDSLIFINAGSTTITATDTVLGYITGETVQTVLADSVKRLIITSPQATVTQGAPFQFTVRAVDRYNNNVVNFVEYVRFHSDSIANVALSNSSHIYTIGDAGTYTSTGNVINGVGNYRIFAEDTASSSTLQGDTLNLTVVGNTIVSNYEFQTLGDTVIAGQNYADSVIAVNGFGDRITEYTDTSAIITSSNPLTIISDSVVHFTNGIGHVALMNFTSVGTRTITIRDSSNASLTGEKVVYVRNGPVTTYAITLPDDTLLTDGNYNFTVEARDVNGNRAIDYRGSVNITTSNGNSTIVDSYTFTAGDAGIHTFTGGVRYTASSTNTTITVTDQGNGSITGNSSEFVVEATPIIQIVYAATSGYNGDMFSTTNLVDTNMFAMAVRNPTDSAFVITRLDLDGTVTGGTFNSIVSGMSVIADANNDLSFEESVEGGASFNYVSNVLQITGLNIAVAAHDTINIGLFGSLTGIETVLKVVELNLTSNTNVHLNKVLSESGENFPISGSEISIDLNANAGTMTAQASGTIPSSANLPNDAQNRRMHRIRLSANNIEKMYVDSVAIAWTGTADVQTDVSQAKLIYDANNDGLITSGELVVDSTTNFTATHILFNAPSPLDSLNANQAKNYIVALSLNGSAISGETLRLQVDSGSVYTTGVVSAQSNRVTYAADPIMGNEFTIQNIMVISSNALASTVVTASETNLQILDLNMSSTAEISTVSSMTLNMTISSGQHLNTVISSALLFRDNNTNGVYDVGTDDVISNSSVRTTSNIIFSSLTADVTGNERWVVQVNLNAAAAGASITTQISASSQVILSQGNLSTDNFPQVGRSYTIESIELDFNALALDAAPVLAGGSEIQMARFDLSYVSGPATASWSGLRVLNRSAVDTASFSDVDSVKLYQIIAGDTTLLSGGALSNDGSGGFVNLSFGGVTVPNGSATYYVAYKLDSAYNPSNGMGLQFPVNAFTLSLNGNTINNLPYTSARDITLPVTLGEFSGLSVNEGIQVNLRTLSEPDISVLYVIRESLVDGESSVVSTITLDGASVSHGADYSFVDKTASYGVQYAYRLEEHYADGTIYVHGSSFSITRLRPESITIKNAYPNPFNPSTKVLIDVPSDSRVDIVIYNALGQVVRSDRNIQVKTGFAHSYVWLGENNAGQKVASGIYFMQIQVRSVESKLSLQRIQKVILVK